MLVVLVVAAVVLLAGLGVVLRVATRGPRIAGLPDVVGGRPLLFLDVDGVIVLPPEGGTGRLYMTDAGPIHVSVRAAELVGRLALSFDVVWATGWEHRANRELLDVLGIEHELPVLTFGKKARYGSADWKIDAVEQHAGDRPVAWLDDSLSELHERWAEGRDAPTLLLKPDSHVGITPEHASQLLAWADAVQGTPTADLARAA